MNKEEKIIDYLQGEMTYEERSKFERSLTSDPVLKAELEEYRLLFDEIDQMEISRPSLTLKSNFDYMLESEMIRQDSKSNVMTLKTWRSAAAVAAILVIGFLVGQNWTQKSVINQQSQALVADMKRNMKSESVTGRIEAVQVSQQFAKPENEVLNTLIETLKNDSSPNVRLAAAEALDRYAAEEKVRTALVRQLSTEKDPFVLIALINTLSEQKVEKAIDPLQELTTAEDVAKFIKDEAHLGLIKIEKI
ncbi:HEAT repeat domain-containing protein [Portibacter marinus]|uniref:HEAT repeat domain-containing protein n=1 Tax=Portibacter marinus TaxID=2898660 RepID=UPI001F1B8F2E|nr:HEAT repeat domain-containing protein [Portibacter marinus]